MLPALLPPPPSPLPQRASPSKAEGPAPTHPPGVIAPAPGTYTLRTSPQRVYFSTPQGSYPAPLSPGAPPSPASSSRAAPQPARPCAACGASPLSADISGGCAACQPQQQQPAQSPVAQSPVASSVAEVTAAPQTGEGGAQTEPTALTMEAVCQYEPPPPDAPPPLTPQQALVAAQFMAITGQTREGAEAALRSCAWALEAALLGQLSPGTGGGSGSSSSSSGSSSSGTAADSSSRSSSSSRGSSSGSRGALSPAVLLSAAATSPLPPLKAALAKPSPLAATGTSPAPPPKPAASKPSRPQAVTFITKAS